MEQGRGTTVELTAGELAVLRELALGGRYADVARALFVSENTIKTHLAAVYRKLGVDRRGEALRVARETHLISAPRRRHPGDLPQWPSAAETW